VGLHEDPTPKGTEICWDTGKYKQSRSEAKRTARRVQKREKRLLRPFLCRSCGMWHIGKPGRREKREQL
jgi:hypothetical protein